MQTHSRIEPDSRITDLVGQLKDDSKRLLTDEVKLAKLEVSESAEHAGRGAMWVGIAFGVGVIGLVALTIFLTTVIGRAVGGHMYVGALVAGALEVIVGLLLFRRGVRKLREPPYTMKKTRRELKETVAALAQPRRNAARAD
jgi:uncharacterized membrane protein YqjE